MATTTTKKKLEENFDVTQQDQAQTAEDVNNQDSRTRLWQSLKTGYDYQKENSNKAYDQNRSAADRAALQRGMGRSSYNLQTLANIDTEKARAAAQIDSNLIADYQNRVTQLEQQEAENERWERQFAEGQRQYNESLAFQKSEADRQQGNWEKDFAAGREDVKWSQDFQQSEADRQQRNLDRDYEAGRSDVAWQQGMSEKQLALETQQWEDQKAQWREQMDYEKMTSSQQIAWNVVMNALESGDHVTDTLLKQAGISRTDYNQMKTTAKKKVSSGKGPGKPKPDDPDDDTDEQLESDMDDQGTSIFAVDSRPRKDVVEKVTYNPALLASDNGKKYGGKGKSVYSTTK